MSPIALPGSGAATAGARELGLDGALELGGVPQRGEVVGDAAARVGGADFPVGGERGFGPGVGEEAVCWEGNVSVDALYGISRLGVGGSGAEVWCDRVCGLGKLTILPSPALPAAFLAL